MSFDIAVWEGDAPESDAAALATFVRLMDDLETADPDTLLDPTPRIRAYVEALVDRWPEDDHDAPWAASPLLDDAWGSAVYVAITWSRADEVSAHAASLAREHGLVCFDPQAEAVRP